MTERDMVCIMCPVGCRLHAVMDDKGEVAVSGQACKRGLTYGHDEFTQPMRMVTSSVWVDGGAMPLASVRTERPVPKESVEKILDALKTVTMNAPVKLGQTVISDVCGTGADIISTRNVDAV